MLAYISFRSFEYWPFKTFFSIAVFPISIPLIIGPSALTLSVLISKNFNYTLFNFYTQFFPMILILMLTSIIIYFSTYLLKILNQTIIKILQKIFGIILGALSVEFIISGIKGVIWKLSHHASKYVNLMLIEKFVWDVLDILKKFLVGKPFLKKKKKLF